MVSMIVATYPWYGETVPLLQVAAGMVARGHRVTVVAGSRFGDQATATGARFVPLSGAADYDDRRLDETFPGRAEAAPGVSQNVFDTSFVLGDAIPEQYRLLQRLLGEDPDQVVLANQGFLGAWPFALGAPGLRPRRWVAVGTNPLYLSSDDTSVFGPVPVEPGGDARAVNRAANAQLAQALQPATDHVASVLRGLGCTEPPGAVTDAIVRLPDVFAELSIADFDFPRTDAPPSLHFVGLLPVRRPPRWSPPPWWSDLDGRRPVVVVTQGTFANHRLSDLVEPTLAGLADADVLVVAALGRGVDGLDVELPANARAAAYIPFDALLPKADVLVTNGGFGSTQQALASAVPVVVAGTTEDKALTAARVASHGVGINLATSTPSPSEVAGAVHAVLTTPTYRDRAADLARDYARHDALDLIEKLAAADLTNGR